jgi:hypothetical protein
MKKTLKELRGTYGRAPAHPSTDHARKMRETFQDDDSHTDYRINATWPTHLYELGQGRSVAYTSNKWKDKPTQFEDYKHVAESPNVTYVTERFLKDARRSQKLRPNGGGEYPEVVPGYEYPTTIAELAPFVFLEVRPIVSWEEGKPKRRVELASHAIQIGMPGCIVYGCYAKKPGGVWTNRRDLKPFLAVIHKTGGVYAIITGRDLDVKKDGIVGLASPGDDGVHSHVEARCGGVDAVQEEPVGVVVLVVLDEVATHAEGVRRRGRRLDTPAMPEVLGRLVHDPCDHVVLIHGYNLSGIDRDPTGCPVDCPLLPSLVHDPERPIAQHFR